MSDQPKVFANGTTWVRADFHMHTKADKEFKYDGEERYFASEYVAALKKAGTRVAVITNHNKFDREEFKSLAKAARKEEILLLPGVELSVKDGANGIHTLVVFSQEWITNPENKNYIQNFLDVTFAGIANFENENGRSKHDLNDTIRELNEFKKDYFLVFAHVEAGSGLWKELAGGRLGELAKHQPFRERCAAFQKVRTRDKRTTVQSQMNDFYPAEVEGCDCKCIEDIGKGKASYLKIGAFTFEAVKFALLDSKHRVAKTVAEAKHSRIKKVVFDGSRLNGTTIHFSPELNTLIGIRGSGKSSVIESVRYALGVELPENADKDGYKSGSVKHALGSGGKVTLFATDRHGTEYEVRRIIDQQPDVYIDGEIQPGISIRETILHKPIYFGQKDLSSKDPGFENDLVEKLVGESLEDVRRKITEGQEGVTEGVRRLSKLSNIADREQEFIAQKQNAEHRLKVFKEHGVEAKLKKQVDFDKDAGFAKKATLFVERYLQSVDDLIAEYESEFDEHGKYTSERNEEFFKDFLEIYGRIVDGFNQIQSIAKTTRTTSTELKAKATEFDKKKDALKEEFAEVARELSEELKEKGATAIEPGDILKLKQAIGKAEDDLKSVGKEKEQRAELETELLKRLVALNDRCHEEFKLITQRLETINEADTALTIEVGYREDKKAFVRFLKDTFKGSNLREATLQLLVDKFADGAAIYRDFELAKKTVGGSAAIFEEWFGDNLATILTFQVPNSFVIKYHGKKLKSHSLGQRASALILFVLSQRDSDVVIIDQPEDDLDNQTIYEDVIKLIRKLKPETQFIFATHNPNIPVLGDSEQIISFKCDDKIESSLGSIDCPDQQNSIVTIMEGGSEAFQRRRDIYQVWKDRTS
ncbi:TrlF family AAA-like ATPase [Novipirellula sp. SH528]|uniref:TrlF family AAA-like ATPase n=1 Tax=Novipirellula sp. SH528 TaxID=3454466 RepID=UPI003FA125FB